ncbi:MAG TPA: hypothetical protein PK796_11035 [Bacteroidales bacterium]|nr:hypothetical protein [Bacteroidales bacterium]
MTRKDIIRPVLFLLILSGAAPGYGQDTVPELFRPPVCGEVYVVPKDFSGKQYFNRNWLPGDVVLTSGDTLYDMLLKYNGFTDELIWLDSNAFRQVKLEKHFINRFTMKHPDGRVILFERIVEKQPLSADSADVFVEVMCDNVARLCVQRQIASRGVTTKYIEGKDYSFDDLKPQPRYMLFLPNHQPVVFRIIGRKTVLRLLPPGYREQAEVIIREHHLSLRNEKQLIQVAEEIR